ncbi:MAG: hypothetical protein V2A54_02825 [Bacteroidota bacterium]
MTKSFYKTIRENNMACSFLTAFFLIAFNTSLFGQIKEWSLKGKTDDGTARAYVVYDNHGNFHYSLVYLNGYKTDTLVFEKKGLANYQIDTFILKPVHVDGKGLKEMLISWQERTGSVSYVNETTILKTKRSLWDLETQIELFSCIDKYCKYELKRDGDEKTRSIDTSSYSFDFLLDENGNITIGKSKSYCVRHLYNWVSVKKKWKLKNVERVVYSCTQQPDKVEGIFRFRDGVYTFEKK